MKYECNVIRDLMPLCAEGMASEASEKTMQAHLAECKDCAAEWESIKDGSAPFPETEVPEETKQYAKTAKRVKHKRIRLLAIAVLTTVAVLVGIFLGILATRLFMPILSQTYISLLPLHLTYSIVDTLRILAVVLVMIVIGLIVLGVFIRKLKINEAVKIGEE